MIKTILKKFNSEKERVKSLKNKDVDVIQIKSSGWIISTKSMIFSSCFVNKFFISLINQLFINNQKRYYGTVRLS